MLRYEVKTNTGKKAPHQFRADGILNRHGRRVHDVHVDLLRRSITVDGLPDHVHFAQLRKALGLR